MNQFNEDLMQLNEDIVQTLGKLAKFKPRFYHSFAKGKSSEFNASLIGYRERLNVIDKNLRRHATSIPDDAGSVKTGSAKLSITFSIRNLTLASLGEAQKLLNDHEAQAGFKLSTNLALLAIVISIFTAFAG